MFISLGHNTYNSPTSQLFTGPSNTLSQLQYHWNYDYHHFDVEQWWWKTCLEWKMKIIALMFPLRPISWCSIGVRKRSKEETLSIQILFHCGPISWYGTLLKSYKSPDKKLMVVVTIMIIVIMMMIIMMVTIFILFLMWSIIARLASEAPNQELIRGETCPQRFSVLLQYSQKHYLFRGVNSSPLQSAPKLP